MSDLALKLIAENKKTRLPFLDLGNCGLTRIPEQLAELVWLEELSFASERLVSVEGQWVMLRSKNIKSLNVKYQRNESPNKLSSLNTKAAVISKLTKLKKLFLNGDFFVRFGLEDISPLANLSDLQLLDLTDTCVSNLSPLMQLSNLQQLFVSRTKVCDLSPLMQLNALQELRVTDTEVCDLSPLMHHSALQILYVPGTQVSDLSPLLDQIAAGLQVIWRLDSSENNGYIVNDCPLTNPPIEIVKQGNAAILNYFNEQQAQGVDHLYEAKMLLIGEGGAGKTSLMRRLYQTDKALPDAKDSTKGIDIHRHTFKLQNGRNFRLNVWDFGGQEIYHATHQFFLTKRSLYVLLDDTLNNYKSVHDQGFKYWLEVVDLLGDKSPVLIFLNEKSGRSKAIDKPGIKGKFTNIKEIYSGNLEVSSSADEIRDAIQYFVQQLPHIGEELPAKWVAIRSDIEELSQQHAYISLQNYFDIYSEHLVFDREKALYLSSYLHDLGVFLHFQDDALLTRTVILQKGAIKSDAPLYTMM